MVKFRIKKGDNVIVTVGKDKGRQGKILKILTKENRAIVSGINMVTKHIKPSQKSDGGIVQKEASIHISNIAYFDININSKSKIGFKMLEDGSKIRVSKKLGRIIGEGK